MDTQPCLKGNLKGGASQVSLDFDSGIENMELEEERSAEATTSSTSQSPTKRNRSTSSANYESTPGQMLSSLGTILAVELPGAEPPHQTSGLALPAPQSGQMATELGPQPDLVAVVLEEVTANLSMEETVNYLVKAYSRHRNEENNCGKRGSVAGPLSTLLASTKHQLVTSLALSLRAVQGVQAPHLTHSPLYSLLAQEKMPFDMAVSLVAVLAPNPTALAQVFQPLLQHCLTG